MKILKIEGIFSHNWYYNFFQTDFPDQKKKLPPTFFPIFAHFYGYGALKYMYTHMCTDIYMLNCDSIKYIIF